MTGHGVSFLFRHIPHWSRHSLIRYPDKSGSSLVDRVRLTIGPREIDDGCQLLELLERCCYVERFIRVGPKDRGELRRNKTTEYEIGVGDCEIASFAVACRARAIRSAEILSSVCRKTGEGESP
jgi:hypothetical protein